MSWEAQKENIQPIPQGRKIEDLMRALTIITDNKSRQHLLQTKKEKFEADIEECKGDNDKQLDIWYEYIDWLEQNVPAGGKVNALTEAIEQCIEFYYSRNEFKQDERLLDVFMKFKRFCDDPVEIFGFLYANSIGTLLSRFYLNWSWQYEIKKNMKRADDILRLGIKNLASPRDVLVEAQTQLKFRLDRMIANGDMNDCPEMGQTNTREAQAELASAGIRAALQTLKFRVTKRQGLKVPINRSGIAIDQTNVGGLKGQTKVVNGVRVPKKPTSKVRAGNKPIDVLAEDENENQNQHDENAQPTIIKKIPTFQPIGLVGRTGRENLAPKRGVIATASKPDVLLD